MSWPRDLPPNRPEGQLHQSRLSGRLSPREPCAGGPWKGHNLITPPSPLPQHPLVNWSLVPPPPHPPMLSGLAPWNLPQHTVLLCGEVTFLATKGFVVWGSDFPGDKRLCCVGKWLSWRQKGFVVWGSDFLGDKRLSSVGKWLSWWQKALLCGEETFLATKGFLLWGRSALFCGEAQFCWRDRALFCWEAQFCGEATLSWRQKALFWGKAWFCWWHRALLYWEARLCSVWKLSSVEDSALFCSETQLCSVRKLVCWWHRALFCEKAQFCWIHSALFCGEAHLCWKHSALLCGEAQLCWKHGALFCGETWLCWRHSTYFRKLSLLATQGFMKINDPVSPLASSCSHRVPLCRVTPFIPFPSFSSELSGFRFPPIFPCPLPSWVSQQLISQRKSSFVC